jgi:hypothetical protein
LLLEDGLFCAHFLVERLYPTVVIGDNPTYVLLPLQLISVILSLATNQTAYSTLQFGAVGSKTFNRREPYPCPKLGHLLAASH